MGIAGQRFCMQGDWRLTNSDVAIRRLAASSPAPVIGHTAPESHKLKSFRNRFTTPSGARCGAARPWSP